MLRLYSFFGSSASWRVRIGLSLKGLDYEYVPVHLRKKEQLVDSYAKTNAMQQVPTLEIGGERTQRITQSMAILEWLDEVHPEPPILPKDPYLRARARMLAELVNAGIQPFQNLSVLRYLKSHGGDPEGWPVHFVSKGLYAFEEEVAETAGRFCVGDSPTLPDLFLVPQIAAARRFGVDLGSCPTIVRIDAAASELPAFLAARPEEQPDFEPS